MLNRSGLIVLEGLDGSGKSTQFERLSAYFSENDIKHKAISFPDYDNPSSVTAIIGLSKNEISKGRRGCACCNMREVCQFRKRGDHCGF